MPRPRLSGATALRRWPRDFGRGRASLAARAAGALLSLAWGSVAAAETGVPAAGRESGGPAAAATVVLEVPFVPQTSALCGGAAAAMVLRHWGRRDVFAEDFAALVDPRLDGIPALRLEAALRERGFETHAFAGDGSTVSHHVTLGRPVILLLEVAPALRHYVVVVAWTDQGVLVHDPADRPFKLWDPRALERAWRPTQHWALLVLPSTAGAATASPLPAADDSGTPAPDAGPHGLSALEDDCGGLVPRAVVEARSGDLVSAGRRLEAALVLCPAAAAPRRELAGVRFRQRQYAEAAALAQATAARAPTDQLAWRLLATSRFLSGREEDALRAWNQVSEPELDLVRVEGLDRTRPAVVSARLGLEVRRMLRASDLRRASRRLSEMPTLSAARLRYEPVGNGRVEVTAATVERPLLTPWRLLLQQLGADALTERQTRLGLASIGSDGGWLEAGTRWWRGRPAAWVTFCAPRALGLPGIVSLEALYDEQRYEAGAPAPLVERRRRASLETSEWLTADLSGRVSFALERQDRGATTALLGLGLERRLAGDHLALSAAATAGFPSSGRTRFVRTEARLAARSDERPARVACRARAGFTSASTEAPFAHWPGAGTGSGRELLLRAHPLLSDGVVVGEAFGRRLFDAGGEIEARLRRFGPAALGVAGFVDAAKSWDRPGARRTSALLVDAGMGLRVRLPIGGALRIDLATPLDEWRLTLSAGWRAAWPR